MNTLLQILALLAIAAFFWGISHRRSGGYQPDPDSGPHGEVVPPKGGSGVSRPVNEVHVFHHYPSPEEAREMGTLDENVPKE